MPNWIEGTMRIRGNRNNIKRFLTEGIHSYRLQKVGDG